MVPETTKTYVSLNGDLLGQTIDVCRKFRMRNLLYDNDLVFVIFQNLEELLDVPTGCGEQIVATMAPNLYVLRYLNVTNTLKNSLRLRIMRNLKIGKKYY